MWTTWVRERAVGSLPPEKLLPDRQPCYVSSWIYVFGVATLAALIVVVVSGMILGLEGPAWWHVSERRALLQQHPPVGGGAVLLRDGRPPLGQVLHGRLARRARADLGHRRVVFLVAIGAAFTGYLSQQNFDSQWIASEGKDGLNSVGIGAFFNVADFGQMYTFHVILLPVAVVALVVWHVLLVRRHGVVPPYPAKAQPRRSPASTAARGERRRERAGAGGADAARPLARPLCPLRPGQGVRRRARRDHPAGDRPHRPLLLPRRPADDAPELGASGPERLRRHRAHRAGWDQRDRRHTARPTPTPRTPPRRSGRSTCSAPGVRIPIDTARTSSSTRCDDPRDPRLKRAVAAYQAAPAGLQEAWTDAYDSCPGTRRLPRQRPGDPARRRATGRWPR